MLKRKIENSGMSLVEVIVSMLVLSIAAVSIMTAFSVSAKANTVSKKQQSVESLLENLTEYAEAGGTNFVGKFSADEYVSPTVSGSVSTETLKGVKQGFFKYNVKISTDTNPTDYNTDLLNDHGVIQFGGSNSNTILIDASSKSNALNDYDGSAYRYFQLLHIAAVEEHNLEENQKVDAGLIAEDERVLWEIAEGGADSMAYIQGKVDRELQLITKEPTANKTQLEAFLYYRLDDGVKYPAATSREYRIPLYVSEVYDNATVTGDGVKHLDQIYVLYSACSTEPADVTINKTDIRMLDEKKSLDAILFIANQEDGTKPVGDAIGESWASRLNQGQDIRISFKPLPSGAEQTPKKLKIYCSAKVKLDGVVVADVTTANNQLVAEDTEIRVVTITFEVTDPQTGAVLASEKVTRLQ